MQENEAIVFDRVADCLEMLDRVSVDHPRSGTAELEEIVAMPSAEPHARVDLGKDLLLVECCARRHAAIKLAHETLNEALESLVELFGPL